MIVVDDVVVGAILAILVCFYINAVSRESKNLQMTMTQKHVALLRFFKSGVDGRPI